MHHGVAGILSIKRQHFSLIFSREEKLHFDYYDFLFFSLFPLYSLRFSGKFLSVLSASAFPKCWSCRYFIWIVLAEGFDALSILFFTSSHILCFSRQTNGAVILIFGF